MRERQSDKQTVRVHMRSYLVAIIGLETLDEEFFISPAGGISLGSHGDVD